METILVTGGSGFIGSHFIDEIIKNYNVVNLDKLTYAGNRKNNEFVENKSNYFFVQGDINNTELLEHIVQEYRVKKIINFAAESHVDRSITDPATFINSNIVGTFNLLNIAKKYNLRYHQVSTDEVFGSLGVADPSFTELTKYDPKSPYSAAKASADMLVKAYAHTFNLNATISCCGNNFGPRQYPEKLIPVVITKALNNQKIPVYGTGLNVRDWIYVNDHCTAIHKILEKGKPGETYCISGRNEMTNLDIVKEILSGLGKSEKLISYVTDRPGHDFRYSIDDTKIRTELGFQPEYTFKVALFRTIKWYENNKEHWKQ